METTLPDKTVNRYTPERLAGLNSTKGIPGPGRPPKSEDEKALTHVSRSIEEKFKRKLTKLLPKTVKTLEAALNAPLAKRKIVARNGQVVEVDPGPSELHAGVRACEIVQDRVLGKPQQSIEHTGPGAQFNVIFAAQQNVKVEPAK